MSTRTIQRIREKYVTGELDKAFYEPPRLEQPKKFSSSQEAQIITIAIFPAFLANYIASSMNSSDFIVLFLLFQQISVF